MSYDGNSGISTIRYNVLNLPDTIQFAAGHQNYYTYDASGKKLEVQNITSRNILNLPQDTITRLTSSTKLTTDYCGDIIYQNDSLKEILTPEGYWQNGIYYYYLKDHQGNTRIVLNQNNVQVEISHYYPDGMRFTPESSTNSAALPYRYNGKELEAMNGLNQYDYGARRRETGIPVWTTMDPLCEKRPWESPYCYTGNNPVNRIDPNGMKWLNKKEDEDYAKYVSDGMNNKIKEYNKEADAEFKDYKKALADGNIDKAKQIAGEMGEIGENISNMEMGIKELKQMGETQDQTFTFNKIDGNVGNTGKDKDGVVIMNIADNGAISNGVHESSHGFDIWKNGAYNKGNAIDGEIKAYGRQFSFNSKSVPVSDFGRANSLKDINQKWVYGINNNGVYLYINEIFGPTANPKEILNMLRTSN
jgi:RHS repeat-associated protein